MSASSYAAADRLIAALRCAGLAAGDLLAAFRAVLGLVMGSAQAEPAVRSPAPSAIGSKPR
ncbi:hypothetical protein [Mycobacterium camsae]|uniref:hypothetical protein n=1 Tax=Mycobacterium gordonae TaxID=1778 RepID=UPI001F11D34C|nr:hypothetical protein [Mycobacterium gordonae]